MSVNSLISITLISLLLFASCREQKPSIDITELEERVSHNADSVIRVLTQMRTGELSPYDDASTALLLTRAELELDGSFSCDSIIDPAYRYMLRHGLYDDKLYATYYRAIVEENSNHLKEASELYLSLLEELETASDEKYLQELKGVTLGSLASLYFIQDYHDEALEYYRQAAKIFNDLQEEESANKLGFMVALNMIGSGDKEQGYQELIRLGEQGDDDEFKIFMKLSLLSHVVTDDLYRPKQLEDLLEQIDYQKVLQLDESYNRNEWSDSPLFVYNINSAFVYYRIGQLDKAYGYVKESLGQISDITPLNVGYFKSAAEIAQAAGEMEQALKFQRIYSTKQDSLGVVMREQQVRGVEAEFRRKRDEALRVAKLRYRLYIWAMVALLFIGATAWVVMAYRRRLRRHQEQISEYISMIESYRESATAFTEQLRESDAREVLIKKYLTSRRDMVQQIASTYYTYGQSSRFAEKMRQLALSEQMLRDIVEMTDLRSGGAVSSLRDKMVGWTAKNYDFAALVIAGFSSQEISVMLGMTLGGVYTLKSKLKRKILDSPEEQVREFLPYFE